MTHFTPLRHRGRAGRLGRLALTGAAALALTGLVACSSPAGADTAGTGSSGSGSAATGSPFDLTSANVDGRPHIDPVPEAVAALKASGFTPVEAGKLTVAQGAFTPPISFLAEDDNQTLLGADPDIGQLVAEGLGLEFTPQNVAWADWPLGVQSGKYDAVIANVTVTEERKDLFDFATYRDDVLSFAVQADSDIDSITEANDVSGLKVVVGSGTNQEKILLSWFDENEKNGLPPGEAVYYDDTAAAALALASGRVDAIFQPNSTNAYNAAVNGETKIVGTLNGGYPENAQIGVATAKGNGLAEAVSIVLDSIIENGQYQDVLDRWALQDEAVTESLVNPPGLPRP
ncbi:ABC transporter substrate-binding protein [Leucobacter massiliensis]|uniref:Amino acid ABC transporter substrate-binding protein n=1 Tax=Leucobacter massiliensis TaxID=1686285 RepID=A0A2S9QKN8_9MICO|nr:ABC transporter substrate-binding protein [Leucobacter massiliensis]PRI10145.1 amino acid ABC transporter substrate-binding protein [Leucobacter massiliensis]